MIERSFDHNRPYKCIAYARMSGDRQNPRSPDQQFNEIDREISARRLNWTLLQRYRDDALSGRLIRKRPGLQQMLSEVRSGIVRPDLLLLDTRMRLGRVDEIGNIRKELLQDHGVAIVTVDSHFANPFSSAGRALETFDEYRSVEDNRTKAHDVSRGKLDQAIRGFWPGGAPPRGFLLFSKFHIVRGEQVLEGKVLIHDPEWIGIVQRIFERADSTGEGQTLLARFINNDLTVPKHLLPISASSIGTMLDNELYVGILRFPKHATDIIDDIRVCEPTDTGKQVIVPDFCPPIVPKDVWERVQATRSIRRQGIEQDRAHSIISDKEIQPLTRGVSLKHLLSGLTRCGHCNAAMVPAGPSRRKDPSRRYVYFMCPRRREGNCTNEQSIPVVWLEELIITLIRKNLFE